MFASQADAKKAGWFSRRHRTREDSLAAAREHADKRVSAKLRRPKQKWNAATKTWVRG